MSMPINPTEGPKNGEITVKTCNGGIHHFTYDLAKQMGAIQHLFPTLTESSIIILEDIEANTFELVLKWCSAVDNIKGTLDGDTARSIVKMLVEDAIDDHIMIYKLILAANFLDIESLWGATTQHLADELNECKTLSDMATIFNIQD